jgi:hypothetical protein
MNVKNYKIDKMNSIFYQLEQTVKHLMMSSHLSEFERGLIWSAYEIISLASRKFRFRNKDGDKH